MGRQYYSRKHYRRLSNGGPDATTASVERIAHRAAVEQANREMLARFAPLTPDKMAEATAWQAARVTELCSK